MAQLSPPDVRTAWIDALSPARFETYVQAAAGDEERALLLYRWNSRVAAAWMPTSRSSKSHFGTPFTTR